MWENIWGYEDLLLNLQMIPHNKPCCVNAKYFWFQVLSCVTLWKLSWVRLSGKQTLKQRSACGRFITECSWGKNKKEKKQDWEKQIFRLWSGLGQTQWSWDSPLVVSHFGAREQGHCTSYGPEVGCKLLQEGHLAWAKHSPSAEVIPVMAVSWVLSTANSSSSMRK